MQTITLPANCDRSTALQLHPELCAVAESGSFRIDGRGCEKAGQLLLQVLLSARRSQPELAIDASPALRQAASLAGLEAALFE
jgi:STAS domain